MLGLGRFPSDWVVGFGGIRILHACPKYANTTHARRHIDPTVEAICRLDGTLGAPSEIRSHLG